MIDRRCLIEYLKLGGAGGGVFVAAVSAVGNVIAEVVDVDAFLVLAVPLELVAAFRRLTAPVKVIFLLALATMGLSTTPHPINRERGWYTCCMLF